MAFFFRGEVGGGGGGGGGVWLEGLGRIRGWKNEVELAVAVT